MIHTFDTFQKVNNAPRSGEKSKSTALLGIFLVTKKTTFIIIFFSNIAFGAYSNDGHDLHASNRRNRKHVCILCWFTLRFRLNKLATNAEHTCKFSCWLEMIPYHRYVMLLIYICFSTYFIVNNIPSNVNMLFRSIYDVDT